MSAKVPFFYKENIPELRHF